MAHCCGYIGMLCLNKLLPLSMMRILFLLGCLLAAVAARQCAFEEFYGQALFSHNDIILEGQSADSCIESCLADEQCLSFDLMQGSGNCYLSYDNQHTAPGDLGPHHGASYYEKICSDADTSTVPEVTATGHSGGVHYTSPGGDNGASSSPSWSEWTSWTEGPITGQSGEETEYIYINSTDYIYPDWDECRSTQLGQLYDGNKDVTSSNLECQRWDTTTPHDHGMRPENFPEGSLTDAGNKCRNPDSEPGGPWCYTTDPETRWEYCDIPFCGGVDDIVFQECKIDQRGRTYRGLESTTRTGRQCQYWVEQTPHKHSMSWKGFPEGSMQAAANFCRNPDGEPDGPWCYTTDPEVRWEYCDVPYC